MVCGLNNIRVVMALVPPCDGKKIHSNLVNKVIFLFFVLRIFYNNKKLKFLYSIPVVTSIALKKIQNE